MSCNFNVGGQLVCIAPTLTAVGNKRIVIDVASVPESHTDPAACTTAGGGITTAQPGTKAFFSLRMLDYAGKPRRTGGDPIVLAVGRGDAIDHTVAITITDNGTPNTPPMLSRRLRLVVSKSLLSPSVGANLACSPDFSAMPAAVM